MICPKCKNPTKVIDSRMSNKIENVESKRRRRECKNKKCKHRFSTMELHYDTLHKLITDYEELNSVNKNDRL